MVNIYLLILTFLGLSGAQCFVAHYATGSGLNIPQQIAAVAAVAFAAAAIWYVLEVKYDWSLPAGRYGLGVPRPRYDACVVFAMGWVWYLLSVIQRIGRRK